MLVKSRPKYITLGILGAMMALLIVGLMYSQGTVRANDGGQHVATGAQVVPTGAAPEIECKWELADSRPGYTNSLTAPTDVPDPRKQYGHESGTGGHDDDAVVRPTDDPACEIKAPGQLPSQNNNIMNMIQVMPLPHLDPNSAVPRRDIQLWMAVDHPNGILNISDTYWKIFHPDGSFKIQVHGTKIGDSDAAKPSPGDFTASNGTMGDSKSGFDHNNDAAFGTLGLSATQRRLTECAGLGTPTLEGSMFHAAWATGQVSADAITNLPNGIVNKCKQNEKAVYYAMFDIVKDQPCGKYRIEAHAVANANEAPVLSNYIDIECFWYLNTDFNGLSWGAITPGIMQLISGDLVWDDGGVASPSGNGPTVHNGGNHPMGIRIHFSEMIQDAQFLPKVIDKFDACFGKGSDFGVLECVGQSEFPLPGFPEIPLDAIMASQVTGFGPNPGTVQADNGWFGDHDQILCANDVGKLDLSIHPYNNLPQGIYTGDFDLWAHFVHDPVECSGDQSGLVDGTGTHP